MAKVQLLHRLRLVPGPAPIVATPAPTAKPIAPVQDADRRTLSFPRGPASGARFTPDYVSEIARFAYFWAWPLVNVFNRYIAFKRVRRPILVGGIAPVALINHVAMLHDHIGWKQRYIACPSQDLIYGFGILDLAREPVVVQVPDFGLLGLSGDRSQDRRFRQSWHDVRYEAGLLSAVRPRLGRQGAVGDRRELPRLDQCRDADPACVSGRRQGGQRGVAASHPGDSGLSAVRVRRKG